MKHWLFLMAMCLGLSSAFADEGNSAADFITLKQAIALVLERNPLLKAADYDAQAAAMRIRQAMLSPQMKANIGVENFAGSGVANGIDVAETTLSLSRILELGGKSKLRGELARQEKYLLHNEQDAERLDLLADTTRRFLHVVTDQERLVIARDALALAKRILNIVEHRVKVGKSPLAERRRAIIALSRNELELEHAEHELTTSRLKLAAMWGETEPLMGTARADLFKLDEVGDFASHARLLERNPDLLRYATAKRLAEARLRLAEADRRPNIEVSGGVRHLSATDDTAFVLSASIPLGSARRVKAVIEEAKMLSSREPLVFEQRRLELQTTLFEIHQELKHAQTAVEILHQRIIPQAELALRDYEKGYGAGRYSFLELIEAQHLLLQSRLEAVMAAADYHRFRIEIERLTGVATTTGATP